jgi:pimeloyl-ACP methyl ester carboxylesterase
MVFLFVETIPGAPRETISFPADEKGLDARRVKSCGMSPCKAPQGKQPGTTSREGLPSRAGTRPFLFLALLLLLNPACIRSDKEEVELPTLVRERNYIEVQDVQVNYVVRGRGDRNVLLVHGFGSSIYSWKEILEALEGDFRVFAMDVKGFGYTEKPDDADYSLLTLIDFLVDFMDAVGVERAALVGNSMGGLLSLATAIDYPERVDRLVLIDSAGYPMKLPFLIRMGSLPGVSQVGKLFYGEWTVRWGLKAVFFDDAKVTPERVRAYYLPSVTPNGIDAPRELLGKFDSVLLEYAARRFKRVRCPTLVIWGDKDPWIPVENAYRFGTDIPDVRVEIIENCGHAPQEEKPEEVIPLLKSFLDAGNRSGGSTDADS